MQARDPEFRNLQFKIFEQYRVSQEILVKLAEYLNEEDFKKLNDSLNKMKQWTRSFQASRLPFYAFISFSSLPFVEYQHIYDAIDKRDVNRKTALHYASLSNNLEAIDYLINVHEMNLMAGDRDGLTALHYAIIGEEIATINYLLEHGANIEQAAKNGKTPLWMACEQGHVDIVKLLLEKGADVNVTNHLGKTPLWMACEEGHVDIVQLLLEKGADVNVANRSGATPLDIARENGHLEIVDLLLKHGADSRYIVVANNDEEEITQTKASVRRDMQAKVVSKSFFKKVKNIENVEYEILLFNIQPYSTQLYLDKFVSSKEVISQINAFIGGIYQNEFRELLEKDNIPTEEDALEEYSIQLRKRVNDWATEKNQIKDVISKEIRQHLNRRACMVKFQRYVDFVQNEIQNGAASSEAIENRLAVVLKFIDHLQGNHVEFDDDEKKVLAFGYIGRALTHFKIDIDNLSSAEIRAENLAPLIQMMHDSNHEVRLEILSLNHNGWTLGHEIANSKCTGLLFDYLMLLSKNDNDNNRLPTLVALSLLTSIPIKYKQDEKSIAEIMESKSSEENPFSLILNTNDGFFGRGTSRENLEKEEEQDTVRNHDLWASADDEEEKIGLA